MNAEYIKRMQQANSTMLLGQNAARATLAEVKLQFPNCAITAHASTVCNKMLTKHRKTFETTVECLFNSMSADNTLKI